MNEEMLMALMSGNVLRLEKTALERLTQDRLASGSLGQDLEEMLCEAGVYWDTLNREYFSIETFQRETFDRLAAEYASKDYT
tara:strand:+ start:572 stop:817 length:246 start_codon:yes stop_codon:yes gene_type:complete